MLTVQLLTVDSMYSIAEDSTLSAFAETVAEFKKLHFAVWSGSCY